MISKHKPHIPNLKAILKLVFSEAKQHADVQYAVREDGGQEGVYLLLSREFVAGITLLDTLVQHDQFTTLGNLKLARDTLQRYRQMLKEDGYSLKEREIWEFIKEVDAVEGAIFRS